MKNHIFLATVILFIFAFGISDKVIGLEVKTTPIREHSHLKNQLNIKTNPATELGNVQAQQLDPNKFSISKAGIIDSAFAFTRIACTQFPNGKILTAWEKFTPDNKCVGEAVIFSEDMQYLSSVYYTNPADSYLIDENIALALDNNTAIIAYVDKIAHNAKYVVIDSNGAILKGPIVFCDSYADSISLTFLPGRKTVLLSYQKLLDITGRGEFQILNEAGERVLGPVIINTKGYTTDIGAAIVDGTIWFDFTCGYAKSKIFDLFGNLVRDDVQFGVKKVGPNQPFVMENGNILLVHVNNSSQGMSLILGQDGSMITNPFPFTSDSLINLSASKLSSGNIFVLYTYVPSPGSDYNSRFTLLDKNGNRIKDLTGVSEDLNVWSDMVSYTILKNGKALIIYGGTQKNASHILIKQLTSYKIINVQ